MRFDRLAGAVLVATFAFASSAGAAPIGFSVDDNDDQLYQIDLATGVATAIGPIGFDDVEGLSFQPGTGLLFGYDDNNDELITIDPTTGIGTLVGASGLTTLDLGMTFDSMGQLWLASEDEQNFWSLDPATGAATLIGSTGREITALTELGGLIYGLDDDNNALVTIDRLTGASTLVGLLGVDIQDSGLAAAGGILWALIDDGSIYTIDATTGIASLVATTPGEFESLAIPAAATAVPEPATLVLLGSGLVGIAARARRRSVGASRRRVR